MDAMENIEINFLRSHEGCYFIVVLFLGRLKIGTSYPPRDTELITTTCKKYHEHCISVNVHAKGGITD